VRTKVVGQLLAVVLQSGKVRQDWDTLQRFRLDIWLFAGIINYLFYIIHHIIVKTNLFLISGLVLRLRATHQLNKLGGLYHTHPGLASLFLIPALSLAGLPPLSGFFAKLALVRAGLETGQFAIVAVALGVSLLTLFSMMKIWNEAFWKPLGENDPPPAGGTSPAL